MYYCSRSWREIGACIWVLIINHGQILSPLIQSALMMLTTFVKEYETLLLTYFWLWIDWIFHSIMIILIILFPWSVIINWIPEILLLTKFISALKGANRGQSTWYRVILWHPSVAGYERSSLILYLISLKGWSEILIEHIILKIYGSISWVIFSWALHLKRMEISPVLYPLLVRIFLEDMIWLPDILMKWGDVSVLRLKLIPF